MPTLPAIFRSVFKRSLTLGHSPDPDDAFMFYGLAKGLIPTDEFRFEHVLQDIQTLNERATRGELDISAISIHAYAFVADRYALLPSGASMGDGYGPIVIRKRLTSNKCQSGSDQRPTSTKEGKNGGVKAEELLSGKKF